MYDLKLKAVLWLFTAIALFALALPRIIVFRPEALSQMIGAAVFLGTLCLAACLSFVKFLITMYLIFSELKYRQKHGLRLGVND